MVTSFLALILMEYMVLRLSPCAKIKMRQSKLHFFVFAQRARESRLGTMSRVFARVVISRQSAHAYSRILGLAQ